MDKKYSAGLVWFRRDLRIHDHAALHHALRNCTKVYCCFVFDSAILDELPRADRRVEFIHDSVVELDQSLRKLAGHEAAGLIALHGQARTALPQLARDLGVQAVFASHDDEPYSIERDAQVLGALANAGILLLLGKDHTVFERDEVLTQAATVFSVFTPYKRAWLKKLANDAYYVKPYPVEQHAAGLAGRPDQFREAVPTLQALGFEKTNLHELGIPTGESGGRHLWEAFIERIDDYDDTRNFPAVKGPSYLGIHLRFGTVSIRQLAARAWQRVEGGSKGAETWLSELV